MANVAVQEATALGRPKVLLNKISKAGPPLSRKQCIMAAQRGDRRVEATSWRPTVLPRNGAPTADKFVLVRAKLLGDSAIEDGNNERSNTKITSLLCVVY